MKKSTFYLLSTIVIISSLIFFFEKIAKEQSEYQSSARNHISQCFDAYKKDNQLGKDQLLQYDHLAYGSGDGCYLLVCNVVKGWEKDNTYQPDTIDCSADSVKKVQFYIK